MTVTDAAAAPTPKLGFAPVIQGTFGVLKRNFGTFVALAAVLQVVPLLIMFASAASVGSDLSRTFQMLSFGGLILSVTSAILAPALLHGTVADLNGRKPTFGECLRSGLRHAIPVFAVLFVATVGAFFGLMLLIVPGVMLAIAWCVATPAKVVERVGVFGALGRSRALTRGNRWRLFWLFVLYFIVYGAFQQTFLGLAGSMPFGGQGELSAATLFSPSYGVTLLVLSVASTLISYTGLSVVYYELRRLKEGIGPEALAAIFD